MDALYSADMLLLGRYRFDQRSRALFHLDSGAHIQIGSRALGVLCVLVEHAGDLVPKDEIMKAVWPETVVEDANLTVHISTLRRILGFWSLGRQLHSNGFWPRLSLYRRGDAERPRCPSGYREASATQCAHAAHPAERGKAVRQRE